jgi:diphthine-ammonia ligase
VNIFKQGRDGDLRTKKEGRFVATKIRVAVLYTGGKDSTFACQRLQELGYDVCCLVSVLSENKESYMWHTAEVELARLSAVALGMPIIMVPTKGEKENEVADTLSAIRDARAKFDFEALASGGIASIYQKERIEKIARLAELKPLSPIWGIEQASYMRNLVSIGYRTIVTSVSAEGLGKNWLGREIGKESVEELIALSGKFGFNPAFEGGEAETFVLDCPIFKRGGIKILDKQIEWNGYYGRLKIRDAVVVPKQNL